MTGCLPEGWRAAVAVLPVHLPQLVVVEDWGGCCLTVLGCGPGVLVVAGAGPQLGGLPLLGGLDARLGALVPGVACPAPVPG